MNDGSGRVDCVGMADIGGGGCDAIGDTIAVGSSGGSADGIAIVVAGGGGGTGAVTGGAGGGP